MFKRIGVLALILTAGAAVLPAVAQAEDFRHRAVERDGYGYYTQRYGDSRRDREWRAHEYRERRERERRWERAHRYQFRYDRDHSNRYWDRR